MVAGDLFASKVFGDTTAYFVDEILKHFPVPVLRISSGRAIRSNETRKIGVRGAGNN